jgi:hypothetical protein
VKGISQKRALQLKEYAKERTLYLKLHPICEVCKNRRTVDIHHKSGREGKLLLNQEHWLAVCRWCHDRIHSLPKWAREMGYRN